MKKIFSKEKFIKVMGKEEYEKDYQMFGSENWIDECNNLTIEECSKKGYLITDNWCIKMEVK